MTKHVQQRSAMLVDGNYSNNSRTEKDFTSAYIVRKERLSGDNYRAVVLETNNNGERVFLLAGLFSHKNQAKVLGIMTEGYKGAH